MTDIFICSSTVNIDHVQHQCFFKDMFNFKKSLQVTARRKIQHTHLRKSSLLSWIVMKCHDSNMPVSLHGHHCPLESLQHVAFTDSDRHMNRCQEMLSQTFQPFWSIKSLPKHVWTCGWITLACQGLTDVLDGMWYPCNQSRMDASCAERSLHCNFYRCIIAVTQTVGQ